MDKVEKNPWLWYFLITWIKLKRILGCGIFDYMDKVEKNSWLGYFLITWIKLKRILGCGTF
jgi:hypothetical protein